MAQHLIDIAHLVTVVALIGLALAFLYIDWD